MNKQYVTFRYIFSLSPRSRDFISQSDDKKYRLNSAKTKAKEMIYDAKTNPLSTKIVQSGEKIP